MCGGMRDFLDNMNNFHPLDGIVKQPIIDPFLQGDVTANGSVRPGSYLDQKDATFGLQDMQQTIDVFSKAIGGSFAGGAMAGGSEAGASAGEVGFDPGGEGMYSAPTQEGSASAGSSTAGGSNSMFDPDAADRLDRSLIGPDAGAAAGSGSQFAPDFVPNGQISNPSGEFTPTASANFPTSSTSFAESSGFPGDPGNLTAGGSSANYGPTSSESGNWYDEFLRRAKANPLSTGMNGMNVGMGLYGLYQAHQSQELAKRASQQQDPFGPQRAQYQAQLQQLMKDPGGVTQLPGYEAGLQAVTRKMASQGYVGSGNMMASLQQYGGQFYDQAVQRLMALSGANITPTSGNVALQGNRDALAMQGQSLNNIVYGLSKMSQ